ncbi:G-protein coupled receptor moody-like [Diadema antillarum]|uniref:G-protein coupled receptor moody-like n=1 Tax=Diadema antillarum TaxID=105358 RepID=UPI003A8C853E
MQNFTPPVDESNESEFEVGFVHRAIGASILVVVAVIGITGNSLVIVATAVSRKLQTITNVFVLSLSVTDLLTCALLPFQSLGLVHPAGWPLDHTFCQVVGASVYISTITSVLTLALIAFNRYYLITRRPADYQWLYKPLRLCLMLAVAWFQSILCLLVPEVVNIETLGYFSEQRWCSWLSKEDPVGIYESIAFVNIFFSFLLIIFCYVKILMRVRQQRQVLAQSDVAPASVVTANRPEPSEMPGQDQTSDGPRGLDAPSKKEVRKRDRQINMNLFFVVCAFFLCVIPHSLCVLIPGHEIPSIYTFILMSVNCCINPLIYAQKHPHFKQVFRALLKCKYNDIPHPSSWIRVSLE